MGYNFFFLIYPVLRFSTHISTGHSCILRAWAWQKINYIPMQCSFLRLFGGLFDVMRPRNQPLHLYISFETSAEASTAVLVRWYRVVSACSSAQTQSRHWAEETAEDPQWARRRIGLGTAGMEAQCRGPDSHPQERKAIRPGSLWCQLNNWTQASRLIPSLWGIEDALIISGESNHPQGGWVELRRSVLFPHLPQYLH